MRGRRVYLQRCNVWGGFEGVTWLRNPKRQSTGRTSLLSGLDERLGGITESVGDKRRTLVIGRPRTQFPSSNGSAFIARHNKVATRLHKFAGGHRSARI